MRDRTIWNFVCIHGSLTVSNHPVQIVHGILLDDSRAYAQIQAGAGVSDVFPKSVPAEAADITFSYHPQFLQGGEVFELSYTTTEEKLTEWTTILKSEAQWIGSNQTWHAENNWGFHGVDALRYQLYWDGGFNHGEICYVLIHEETERIIFYYSKW